MFARVLYTPLQTVGTLAVLDDPLQKQSLKSTLTVAVQQILSKIAGLNGGKIPFLGTFKCLGLQF